MSDDASGTVLAVAFGTNVQSGNLICVHCVHGGTLDYVSTLVDTLTTSFTERNFTGGANGSGSVWSGIASQSGADTVTMTLSSAHTSRRVAVHEVSGFATFDAASGLRTAPNPCSSGNITPSVDGCYLFGCCQFDVGGNETYAAGTNVAWTLRENYQHANAPCATEDFIQSTAAAVNTTFTEGNPTAFNGIAFIMAFQPVAGGGIAPQSGRWASYRIPVVDLDDLLDGRP